MDTIFRDDWKFDVDREKTAAFYLHRPTIHTISQAGNEVADFLTDLGIDITKPVECYADCKEAVFLAFGVAHSEKGYELDFPIGRDLCSIIVYPDNAEDAPTKDARFSLDIINYDMLLSK